MCPRAEAADMGSHLEQGNQAHPTFNRYTTQQVLGNELFLDILLKFK